MKYPNVFNILCQRCGLLQREAAKFLDVSLSTVKAWGQNKNSCPDGVICELIDLYDRMEIAADEALTSFILQGEPAGVVELGVSVDDAEAQTLGWPCVGTHAAVLGLVSISLIAEGHRVKIVPRGSTVVTAAAADAHNK